MNSEYIWGIIFILLTLLSVTIAYWIPKKGENVIVRMAVTTGIYVFLSFVSALIIMMPGFFKYGTIFALYFSLLCGMSTWGLIYKKYRTQFPNDPSYDETTLIGKISSKVGIIVTTMYCLFILSIWIIVWWVEKSVQ